MLLQMVLHLIWKRQVRVATCIFHRRGDPMGLTCWGGVFLGHSSMKSRSSNTPRDGGRRTRSQGGAYVKPIQVKHPSKSKKYRRNGLLRVGEVPGIARSGNSSFTETSQNPSTDGYIRKSSRARTVPTPFRPEDTPRKKGQEKDKEELELAVASALDARQKACSNPFWKKMETCFAPIPPEDLLELQQPCPYKVRRRLQSQISSDERDALDVITEDSATNFLKSGTVPSLFQTALAALIDEDDSEHIHDDRDKNQPEDILEAWIQSNEAENTRSESDQYVTGASSYISNEQCQTLADEGKRVMHEYIRCKVLDLPLPEKVKIPKIRALPDHEYQTSSLDEKLMLEFQSLGLNIEKLSCSEENVGSIEQEIKAMKEKLRQQGNVIKEKFTKIEKVIEHEKDLEKGSRTTEEARFEKLVEIANKKLPPWRKNRFSKNPCSQKSLAFIERTLDRYKEYEETGKSCFSVLNLQDTMLRAPPCTTDKENVQLNCMGIASSDSTEVDKRGKAKASAPSTSVSGTMINKMKRKRGADKPLSTALLTLVPNTDRARSSSSKPYSNQDVISSKKNEKVNNDETVVVEEEEEAESDEEITRLIRLTKRKKMTSFPASCSIITPTEKHDELPLSSSPNTPTAEKHVELPSSSSPNTPTTERRDELPLSSSANTPTTEQHVELPLSSSPNTPTTERRDEQAINPRAVDNVDARSNELGDVLDLHRRRIGEEADLQSILEFMDKEDEARQSNGVGLDVPTDVLCDVDDALWTTGLVMKRT